MGEIEERHMLTGGAQRQRDGEMEMGEREGYRERETGREGERWGGRERGRERKSKNQKACMG